MTDTATPAAPKKWKNLFFFIALILTAWGVDNYKTHFFFGTDVTITDSTIVITPSVDTTTTAHVVADSAKKDTTK